MPGKRKSLKNIAPIEREEIIETIYAADRPLHDKALAAVLFLTGARVSEIVKNRKKDWNGITLGQIELLRLNGQDILLFKNIPTEKRRTADGLVLRNIPVNYELEKPLVEIIDAYCGGLPQHHNQVLFNISRKQALRIIKKINPNWFCHFMRHMRLTDLAVKHDFKDTELKQITGWRDTRPAETYVHLQWQDVAMKQLRATNIEQRTNNY